MASRVKGPDTRRPGSWLTALPPLCFVALVVAGCPPHEARLSITNDGIQTLVTACRPCARTPDGGIEAACACAINGRAPPAILSRGVQARLFLVTPSDQIVRDASKCMTLLSCGDGGRPADCFAESLNQQLDRPIPRGLGYDGLQTPDALHLMPPCHPPLQPPPIASS